MIHAILIAGVTLSTCAVIACAFRANDALASLDKYVLAEEDAHRAFVWLAYSSLVLAGCGVLLGRGL